MAKERTQPCTVTLHGSVDIDVVESCYKELNDAFIDGTEVTIDLSEITSIDTSGLQLLVAARKESAKTNIPLKFVGAFPKNIAHFKEYLEGKEVKDQMIIKSSVEDVNA